MNPLWIVVIVLLLLVILGFPAVGVWPHTYGYYPSGLLTIVLVVLVVLLLLGKL